MGNDFIMRPKVDFCFKELMEDEEVRKGFIAAILSVPPEEIVETELLPTNLRREHEDDKLGILDVRVLLNGEIQIDMEIQLSPFRSWPERSLFYLSKMYVDQIHKGDKYNCLKKCIHVGILDFELFQGDKAFYSRFHIWEDDRRRKYSDKFEIHILELPKLKKYEYPETELLNWMRFMNAENKEEFEMLAKGNNYMKRAYERLSELSEDEMKKLEYEAREKAIRDHDWQMQSCREEGFDMGYKDGYNLGYDKGSIGGKIKGYISACAELGVSEAEIVKRIMNKYSVEEEKAIEYMKEYHEIGEV